MAASPFTARRMADGETGLHLFVATITDIASDMLTTASGEHFTVEQYGGERFCFAVPKCAAGPHGLTITNWSVEDFKLFFDVTESSEFYLARPTCQNRQEPYVSCRQERMEAAALPTVSVSCDRPFTPLSLSTLSPCLLYTSDAADE